MATFGKRLDTRDLFWAGGAGEAESSDTIQEFLAKSALSFIFELSVGIYL